MDALIGRFAEHADIGHLALLFWAVAASWQLARTLGDANRANERFDAFVRELAQFNRRHDDHRHNET
jgi:hypothetical protein